MTLLHTKGYSEVLESVKRRAQKKAAQMARMPVSVPVTTLLEHLRQIANTIVLLAVAEVEGSSDGVSYWSFAEAEDDELRLIAAEQVLHHYRYELEQVRREKARGEDNHRPDDPLGPWAAHHESGCRDCEAKR